jgi:hypothetical protein
MDVIFYCRAVKAWKWPYLLVILPVCMKLLGADIRWVGGIHCRRNRQGRTLCLHRKRVSGATSQLAWLGTLLSFGVSNF